MFAGEAGIITPPEQTGESLDAFRIALDELIAAANGGPQLEMDVRFGARVTAILAAAEESAKSGRTVTL
jgi:hypothetical protein